MIKIFVAGVSCSSCHALKRKLEPFLKNNPEYGKHIEYVDAFNEDEQVEKYGVMAAPTMVALDEKDNVLWRVDGFKPDYDYETAITEYVKNYG